MVQFPPHNDEDCRNQNDREQCQTHHLTDFPSNLLEPPLTTSVEGKHLFAPQPLPPFKPVDCAA